MARGTMKLGGLTEKDIAEYTKLRKIVGTDALDLFKDQLMIAMIKRLADAEGKFVMPVSEIDETGANVVAIVGDPQARTFTFRIMKKN